MRNLPKNNSTSTLITSLKSLEDKVAARLAVKKKAHEQTLSLLQRCVTDLQTLTIDLISEKPAWTIVDVVLDHKAATLSFTLNLSPVVAMATQFNGATVKSCSFLIKTSGTQELVINSSLSSTDVPLRIMGNSFLHHIDGYIGGIVNTTLVLL